jgi:hypothetical protein
MLLLSLFCCELAAADCVLLMVLLPSVLLTPHLPLLMMLLLHRQPPTAMHMLQLAKPPGETSSCSYTFQAASYLQLWLRVHCQLHRPRHCC